MALGVGAEPFEHDARPRLARYLERTGFGKFGEGGQIHAPLGRGGPGRLVDALDPLRLGPALGELLRHAEPGSYSGEYLIVIARDPGGFAGGLCQGDDGVAGRGVEIATLQRRRAGKHDIGAAGGSRPAPFVDDDGLRALPRLTEAVEVLMMVERVAAGPVDEAYVGIQMGAAVIVERLARIEQHVADARHGDEVRDAVAALRQRGEGQRPILVADRVRGAVSEADAAAGQADLAEQGGDRDRGPVGMLAILLAR